MVAAILDGQMKWSGDRDEEGHRTYKITHRVEAAFTDGPWNVMNATGLPLVGSYWNFDGDSDPWAFCYPTMKVTPEINDGEKNKYWRVEQTFSTKPLNRCQDESIEDPLLEPQKVSGSFVKYTQEATRDRFGQSIVNSAHEHYRGPRVEFDHNRPTVRIEQNVASLGLDTFSQLIDHVNDSPMWGLPARTVKLSNVSWERKLHGICNFYYTRIFDFDINYFTFDRKVPDEGTKVLHGHWASQDDTGTGGETGWVLDNINGSPPDPNNPQHFDRFKDRRGENARTLLDGAGKPLEGSAMGTGGTTDPIVFTIEYYPESNLLALGVPTSF